MPDSNASAPNASKLPGALPVRRALPLEVILLIVLVFGIYFTRLPALPCSLDEPQWATDALEMVWSGDWVVPRLNGVVSSDRPPAHEWLIAGSILALGSSDMTAPRLPSALATLFTALLVYGFTRTMLSAQGALAAGAVYATMWEVLAKGSTADSEAVFTLFVTASLFLWALGYIRKWPPLATWACGYFFAALSALTKGPQGLYFFAAPVFVFLILRRDRRFLLSRFHASGVALFAVVVGAWLVPFWLKTDSHAVKVISMGVIQERFANGGVVAELKHLLVYPFDVVAMMLPWSLLLALYARRDFRQQLAGSRAQITFLYVTMAVSFIPMWLPPSSHARYLMPVFPCFAVLVGIVLDRLIHPPEGSRIPRITGVLRSITGVLILITGILILGGSWLKPDSYLAQPKWFAVFYFAAATAIALALFRASASPDGRSARLSTLMIAAFIGLWFTGVRTNEYVRYKVDIQSEVDAAKKLLPPDTRLVCLGYVHPVFAYYFGAPISPKFWPKSMEDVTPDTGYFCFSADQHPDEKLPFAWTRIADVRCDRGSLGPSTMSVVIGHREPDSPGQAQ